MFFCFLPPGPIDYAEYAIQGSQEGYAGGNNQHNIHLVFWCLPGRELTTLGHESAALTTRSWLLAIMFLKTSKFVILEKLKHELSK